MALPETYNTGLTESELSEAFSMALNSVQKVEGMGLSENSYTNSDVEEVAKIKEKADILDFSTHVENTDIHFTAEERAKLAGLENYDDSAILARISALEEIMNTM